MKSQISNLYYKNIRLPFSISKPRSCISVLSHIRAIILNQVIILSLSLLFYVRLSQNVKMF